MSAGLEPEPSTASSTSSSIHSPDVERQAPAYLEAKGRIPVGTTPHQRSGNKLVRTVKWVVGHDDNAPESIGSDKWLGELFENPKASTLAYFRGLFPFLRWLPNYNLTWLTGDLIAGITVGMVLVPQSMSYAKLAGLAPEFGLYSSFAGVVIYAFFATSKDVSIGPVAVMSLQTGRIVADVIATHGTKYAPEVIATAVAFICGFIVLGIGLLRLGWIVEFIPVPAVAGFMTGSAINIAAGQVPGLLGTSKLFDTRAATYEVIINTLKFLPSTKLDAAFGIPALAGLYIIKWSCNAVEKRSPKYKRVAFFVSVLRNAFILIIFTIASWKITYHKKPTPISILGTVPSGFKHVGQPYITSELISAFAGKIPVATIILLLEHISISKSFGRLNNYKIDPNQELIAIGVTNTLGSVFNAYPATGSFSRSALKSKSGVRTPAAGWPTAICVLIALYALTDAFFFIPNAVLSAIIIHAVADLVVSPRGAYAFWRVSPFEFFIWLAAVLVSVFSTIENGIYTSLAASLVLLLFRIAKPGGAFLGRVRVGIESKAEEGRGNAPREFRDVYVPLDTGKANGIANPHVKVELPPPGIVIYRFEESFIYPNASHHNSKLVDYVKRNTRRGRDETTTKLGDRPWNDPGPNRWSKKALEEAHKRAAADETQTLQVIRAVVLDFQAVANLDTTGVQNLVDTRKEIERWADAPVSFHFSGVISPWVQRALIAGGFGAGNPNADIPIEVANVTSHQAEAAASVQLTELEVNDGLIERTRSRGVLSEKDKADLKSRSNSQDSFEPLVSTVTPFFHFDLAEAVRAAEAEVKARR